MSVQDLKSTISNSAFSKSYSISNISFKNFFTSIELYTNTDGQDLDSIFKLFHDSNVKTISGLKVCKLSLLKMY